MAHEKAYIKANGMISDPIEAADWLYKYVRRITKSGSLNMEETRKTVIAFQKRYEVEHYLDAESLLAGLAYYNDVVRKYHFSFLRTFGQYYISIEKRDESLNCLTSKIKKVMTTKKSTKKTAKKSTPKAKTTTAKRKSTAKQLEALKKAREARAEAKKAEQKATKAKAEAKKTINKAKATAKKVKASAKKSIKKALTTAKKQVRKTVSKATTSTRKRITKGTKAIIDRTAKSLKKKGLAGCSNLDAVNCLFYYMWNEWSKEESLKIFGNVMGEHFYSKWNIYNGNVESLWANMSDENRE